MRNGKRVGLVVVLGCLWGVGSMAVANTQPGSLGTLVGQTTVRGHDVAVYQIGQVEASNTPTGMDGFAEHVGAWLHNWTQQHGVEAIANLCQSADGSQWGARILTIYAHTSSPRTNACPDGMRFTGVTIHSHPQRHRYLVNGVDRLFLKDGLMDQTVIATWPDEYSGDDLAAGPGYLVGAIRLHYQDGHGHQHVVASISDCK